MKKTFLALGLAVAAGGAVALPAAYAAPPPAAPAGCLNIIPGSEADYTSLYTQAVLVDHDGNPLTERQLQQTQIGGGGLVQATLQLEEASCTDAGYVLSVYSPLPDSRDRLQLIETKVTAGNGSRTLLLSTVVNDLPDTATCVRVVLSTVDSAGRTADLAPDEGAPSLCKDGGGGFTYGG